MIRTSFATNSKKQVLDITGEIGGLIQNQPLNSGLCHLFILHTTACLTTADLDPGTDLDLLDALDGIIPKLNYRHPHNPVHVGDHINSSLIGPQVLLPFENKKLILGAWQRVVLIELDGPRKRDTIVSFVKT